MQQAVAAYVCPNELVEHKLALQLQSADDGTMMDMSDCAGQDRDAPTLCHAYDVAESRSLDKPGSPPVQPFQPSSLQVIIEPAAPQRGLLHRCEDDSTTSGCQSSLPLSIRNCRFLI